MTAHRFQFLLIARLGRLIPYQITDVDYFFQSI